MKALLASLILSLSFLTHLRAAEDPKMIALRTADDARVAAMLHPTAAALDTVLSPDLHYAHSNGKVDSKASLTTSLLNGEAKYISYKYKSLCQKI